MLNVFTSCDIINQSTQRALGLGLLCVIPLSTIFQLNLYGFWFPLWCLQTILTSYITIIALRCLRLVFYVWRASKSRKQTYKTKDQVTRTPLKIGGEFICSERVSSSCSASGTRRVNLVTNPVINHERGKDLEDVCFLDCCLSFCTFSSGHCVGCSSAIYGFWFPLWCLQTILTSYITIIALRCLRLVFYVWSRRTANTMAGRKSTKGQTTIKKTNI
jgi:hypothetical protein